MQIRLTVLSMLVMTFLVISPVYGTYENIENIIEILDEQVASATDMKEKAKFCCFRARNYSKIKAEDKAEQSYLEALEYNFSGWILHEYSRFLYKQGEYERAYRAAVTIIKNFPHFSKQAEKLRKSAEKKYREEYYEENPPTIIMNTVVDPNRVSRHDLIRKVGSSRKTTIYKNNSATRSSPVSSSSSKSTGRTVRS